MFEGLIVVLFITAIAIFGVIIFGSVMEILHKNVAEPTMKSSSETLYRMRKKKYHALMG